MLDSEEDETAFSFCVMTVDFLGMGVMGRSFFSSFVIVLCTATFSLVMSKR